MLDRSIELCNHLYYKKKKTHKNIIVIVIYFLLFFESEITLFFILSYFLWANYQINHLSSVKNSVG